MYQHWKAEVVIIQEGTKTLPLYDQCGMHMTLARLTKHRRMARCEKEMETRIRRIDVEMTYR